MWLKAFFFAIHAQMAQDWSADVASLAPFRSSKPRSCLVYLSITLALPLCLFFCCDVWPSVTILSLFCQQITDRLCARLNRDGVVGWGHLRGEDQMMSGGEEIDFGWWRVSDFWRDIHAAILARKKMLPESEVVLLTKWRSVTTWRDTNWIMWLVLLAEMLLRIQTCQFGGFLWKTNCLFYTCMSIAECWEASERHTSLVQNGCNQLWQPWCRAALGNQVESPDSALTWWTRENTVWSGLSVSLSHVFQQRAGTKTS